MKHQILVSIIFTGLMPLFSGTLFGQHINSVINPAGKTSKETGVSISYSIGETAVSTLNSGGIILKQGFLPYFPTVTAIEGENEKDWIAYPNPTSGMLFIKAPVNELTYEIIDVQGKKYVLNPQNKQLDMRVFPAGLYALRISSPNQPTRIFKILKVK